MPAAPVLFSTITGWPSATRSFSAISRAGTSLGPPAGKPTTMRTVLLGNASCAAAEAANNTRHAVSAARTIVSSIPLCSALSLHYMRGLVDVGEDQRHA